MYDNLYGLNCSDWAECSASCNPDPPLAAAYQSRTCACRDLYRDVEVRRLRLASLSHAVTTVAHRRRRTALQVDISLCQGSAPMALQRVCTDLPLCPPIVTGVLLPPLPPACCHARCSRCDAALHYALLLQKSRHQQLCLGVSCSYG
jgi:hypothetical protein